MPGAAGTGHPPHRHSRAGGRFSGRNVHPEGQSEGKPPCPFRSQRKGRERAKRRSRGMPGAGTGGAEPPAFHHLPRQESTPSPFASSVRGTRASGARPQGDAPGRRGQAIPPPSFPRRRALQRTERPSRRAERGQTPCPFRSQRKGRVQAKRCTRGMPGAGTGGAELPGLPPLAQAVIHTVPLRSSVRGTRTSEARTQGDARGGGAGRSPSSPPSRQPPPSPFDISRNTCCITTSRRHIRQPPDQRLRKNETIVASRRRVCTTPFDHDKIQLNTEPVAGGMHGAANTRLHDGPRHSPGRRAKRGQKSGHGGRW